MVHLIKLAVGVRDAAHLRDLQAARAAAMPPLRHQTRHAPRRVDEITDGGSIYWVIQGALSVRQRVLEIVPGQWDDGSACAALILDPVLVPVVPRLVKPFQGWRYLAAADAPADLDTARPRMRGAEALPPALRRELETLCLL